MASTYEPIEYDIGEVRALFDSCIIIGTVTSVDHDTNKASVTTDDWETISDIPIHYHCPDTETVDDGHQAFEEDDEVYILHDGSSFPPSVSTMKVVGRVEGLKLCFIAVILINFRNTDYIVWDPKNDCLFKLYNDIGDEITQPNTLSNINGAKNLPGSSWTDAATKTGEETPAGKASVSLPCAPCDQGGTGYWPKCEPCFGELNTSDSDTIESPIPDIPDSTGAGQVTATYTWLAHQCRPGFTHNECNRDYQLQHPKLNENVSYCVLPNNDTKHFAYFWLNSSIQTKRKTDSITDVKKPGEPISYTSFSESKFYEISYIYTYYRILDLSPEILANQIYFSEIESECSGWPTCGETPHVVCTGTKREGDILGDSKIGIRTYRGSAILAETFLGGYNGKSYAGTGSNGPICDSINWILQSENEDINYTFELWAQLEKGYTGNPSVEADYNYVWGDFIKLDMVNILSYFPTLENVTDFKAYLRGN